uniref:Probable protein-export membrane protein SecG n=1 Tax=Porolithon onkodes TaxID=231751 RepID=A0A2Z2L172_9FLOR|nr:preprotein translocase subunit G [Porolithon onkodes]ASB29734.1 preprotein translocase subunit G [Porolithon onkodes]
MKFFWYLSSILTIFFILINNPKASSIGSDSQLFSYTKSTQSNVHLLTVFVSAIFLLLTILLMGRFYP